MAVGAGPVRLVSGVSSRRALSAALLRILKAATASKLRLLFGQDHQYGIQPTKDGQYALNGLTVSNKLVTDTKCQGRTGSSDNPKGQHGQPNRTRSNQAQNRSVNVADSKHKGLERSSNQGTRYNGQLGGKGSDKAQDWTIVTGGFPCQPFSAAGRRKGTADDRYQWPNMFEVIRNTSPEWVIAENVRGLVTWNDGLVLETVCADLESEGYEVQPFIIPAVAVGAPHRRDRVWIIGHNADTRCQQRQQRVNATLRPEAQEQRWQERQYPDWSRNWQEVAFATCNDTIYDGLPTWLDGVIRGNGGLNGTESETVTRQDVCDLYAAFQSEDFRAAFGRCYKVRNTEVLLEVLRQLSEDTETTERNFQLDGTSFTEDYVRQMQQQAATRRPSSEWERNRQSAAKYTDAMPQLSRSSTLEIAKAWYCVRLVQQSIIMEPIDNGEIKLSASAHRQNSLKAYGNGIVHQVATEILRAVKEQQEV